MPLVLNYSDFQSTTKLSGILNSIIKELKIKTPVTLLYQDIWSRYDVDTGKPIPVTEDYTIEFDAEACDNGVVQIVISPKLKFDFTWEINEALPEFYLRHVTTLKNIDEMLVYVMSHELYHIFQWENPKKATALRDILNCDDETSADIFAIMQLSKLRNK